MSFFIFGRWQPSKNFCLFRTIMGAVVFCAVVWACESKNAVRYAPATFAPVSQQLFDTIMYWDSVFYDHLLACRLQEASALVYTDLEYYDDERGLMVSHPMLPQLLQDLCGRKREVAKESREVYPVRNFGAVQSGQQIFYPPDGAKSTQRILEKFIHVWRNVNGQWRLTRLTRVHPGGGFRYDDEF